MPTAALYASILTVIALILAQLVIRNRVRAKVALGDGSDALYLHIAGLALVAARIIHPFGITVTPANHPLRIGATIATNTVQPGLIVLLVLQHFA